MHDIATNDLTRRIGLLGILVLLVAVVAMTLDGQDDGRHLIVVLVIRL